MAIPRLSLSLDWESHECGGARARARSHRLTGAGAVGRGQTVMDISELSFYTNEKESLLAPGTQLRVVSRSRKGLITEIRAEELGRALS